MKKDEVARPRGRPRGFNRDEALARAMRLFWERGYEGTSVAELVKALGITPPALYAAFGSKEALYWDALRLYLAEGGRFYEQALDAPGMSARDAVSAILRGGAEAFAGDTTGIAGCMLSTAVLGSAPEHQGVARDVGELRRKRRELLAARLARARAEGELPAGTDAAVLADFYVAVLQGMAIQARDGAGRDALMRLADTAMRAWPDGTPGRTAA